jgi:hypothetical protein
VSLSGGPQRVLADSAFSGLWTDDGAIYFYHASSSGRPWIERISQHGGDGNVILSMDGRVTFTPSAALPGNRILGTLAPTRGPAGDGEARIGILDPATGSITLLIEGRRPQYEPRTQSIVYIRETSLMAAEFDPGKLEITGPPFPLADDIGDFALARDGTLMALLGRLTYAIPILVDRRGIRTELMPELTADEVFADAIFSPDGRRLAFELRRADSDRSDIWVYDLPNGPRTRLTFDGGSHPAWTTDGRFVLFSRADGVYRARTDASAPPELLLRAESVRSVQAVPGGGLIFERTNGVHSDIGYASLDNQQHVSLLVAGDANERNPTVSADGRWFAYQSDHSGTSEIYVAQLSQPERPYRVSIAGGYNPAFSNSGHSVFFVNANRDFEVVSFRAGTSFEILDRTELFNASGIVGRLHPAPGDSLFIAKRPGGSRTDAPVMIVRNWVKELQAEASRAAR